MTPITFERLKLMWPALLVIKDSLMFQAAISLAFFAGLRGAEYTWNSSLKSATPPVVGQVSFNKVKKFLHFKVLRSKTSKHGFTSTVGCSEHDICAYCTLLAYLKSRSITGDLSDTSPLFLDQESRPLSKTKLDRTLKAVVASLGWDPSTFSTHAIRAGTASSAAQAHFLDWEIKSLGGWKSQAYTGYIRDKDSHEATFSKRLTCNTT